MNKGPRFSLLSSPVVLLRLFSGRLVRYDLICETDAVALARVRSMQALLHHS